MVPVDGQSPHRGHEARSGRTPVAIRVPSTATPFIQEAHIAIGHAICGVVEAAVAPAGEP